MTELEAVLAEVNALRDMRAGLEVEVQRLTLALRTQTERAHAALEEVARLRDELNNAQAGLTGDAKALVQMVDLVQSELRRERARFKIIAREMPTFLADFLATYSPFAPEALSPEYRRHLQTAREFLKVLEPFGE